MNTLERCPGCAATFPTVDGATHPYIGASAACWALYSAVLAGGEPPPHLLANSKVVPVKVTASPSHPNANLLLVDAYAAQHHGDPSPQAIQSVAVHLLVLHGVLSRMVAPEAALWIRRRAMRRKGVYAWLSPPPPEAAYALRHCFPGPDIGPPQPIATYVGSVYMSWRELHGSQLDAWYDEFVAA